MTTWTPVATEPMNDAEIDKTVTDWLHEAAVDIEEARAFGQREAMRLFNLGIIDDVCLGMKLLAIGHLHGKTKRQKYAARLV